MGAYRTRFHAGTAKYLKGHCTFSGGSVEPAKYLKGHCTFSGGSVEQFGGFLAPISDYLRREIERLVDRTPKLHRHCHPRGTTSGNFHVAWRKRNTVQ